LGLQVRTLPGAPILRELVECVLVNNGFPLKVLPLKYVYLISVTLLLAACQNNSSTNNTTPKTDAVEQPTAIPFAFEADNGPLPALAAGLEMMPLQITLERLGFSPGVINGKNGESLKIALRGFQAANEIEETGELDAATKSALASLSNVVATKMVQIPADFANQTFYPDLPKDAAEQAKLAGLGYRNLMEALAERFHTTQETLVALNSAETPVGANRTIVVPNIADVMAPGPEDAERGWDKTLLQLGIASEQPAIETIVVDKSGGWLRAVGVGGKIIAQFPVTTGSSRDPLPLGNWTVKGIARNPEFHYNPKLFWDVSDRKEKQLLQPGPNSPVGVVWIDLSKPHYGIHGTNEPKTIGRSESHGCVRLTNWDAAKLAGMIKPGTKVLFQQ
jgi:lipoprotein-anchoring transpeptidase ErfK/SrfK